MQETRRAVVADLDGGLESSAASEAGSVCMHCISLTLLFWVQSLLPHETEKLLCHVCKVVHWIGIKFMHTFRYGEECDFTEDGTLNWHLALHTYCLNFSTGLKKPSVQGEEGRNSFLQSS